MSCYCGITQDLKTRKEQHERDYPTLRNWKTYPFKSREEAQAWEDRQTECEHHSGGRNPDDPYAQWYGYRFDY